MKVESIYSHSVLGLFWFDIPLAVFVAFIYHDIVQDRFILNLPGFLRNRLNDFRSFNWNVFFRANWLIVFTSILIGAASHLLWDSFTHPQGYFVHHIYFLQRTVKIFSVHIYYYRILQQLSSLIGGIIVLSAILSLKVKSSPQPKNQTNYWLIVTGTTLSAVGCRFLTGMNVHLYGDVIVTVISGFLIGLVIAPIILTFSTGANTH